MISTQNIVKLETRNISFMFVDVTLVPNTLQIHLCSYISKVMTIA